MQIEIIGSGHQLGPNTDRHGEPHPLRPLRNLLVEAGGQALAEVPHAASAVDVVFVGTMGAMGRAARHRLHPAHLAREVAERLGLSRVLHRPDGGAGGCRVVLGTSDAGARAIHAAWEALRRGECRTALVLGGEQMFSAPPEGAGPEEARLQRDHEREDLQAAIQSVVHPAESMSLGLTMLSVGDLLMDAIVGQTCWSPEVWRRMLRAASLAKLERSKDLDSAMMPAKERRPGARALDAVAYDSTRILGRWLRAHDVGAPCNAASAVILSADPALHYGAPRLSAVAAAEQPARLGARPAPFGRVLPVEASFQQLAHFAALPIEAFWDTDKSAAFFHDAFPSVELVFAFTLARLAQPEIPAEVLWNQAVQRWLTGWTNPVGGLRAAGHAQGNSGVYQLVTALRWLQSSHSASGRTVERVVITSVGSALTRVTSTLLLPPGAAFDAHFGPTKGEPTSAFATAFATASSLPLRDSECTAGGLGKVAGVTTYTPSRPGGAVAAVEVGECVVLALLNCADGPLPSPGDEVQCVESELGSVANVVHRRAKQLAQPTALVSQALCELESQLAEVGRM